MINPRLFQYYKSIVVEDYILLRGLKTIFELPNIESVILHSTSQKFVLEKKYAIVVDSGGLITIGQKCVNKRARKSIAQFALRKGEPIGIVGTRRGLGKWHFLDRLLLFFFPENKSTYSTKNKSLVDNNRSIGKEKKQRGRKAVARNAQSNNGEMSEQSIASRLHTSLHASRATTFGFRNFLLSPELKLLLSFFDPLSNEQVKKGETGFAVNLILGKSSFYDRKKTFLPLSTLFYFPTRDAFPVLYAKCFKGDYKRNPFLSLPFPMLPPENSHEKVFTWDNRVNQNYIDLEHFYKERKLRAREGCNRSEVSAKRGQFLTAFQFPV